MGATAAWCWFCCEKSLASSIEPLIKGTEYIISLRLSSYSGSVNVLSIYAPTFCSSVEQKDQFYEDLDALQLKELPPLSNCIYLDTSKRGLDLIISLGLSVLDILV